MSNKRMKIGTVLAPEVLPRMDNYRQSLRFGKLFKLLCFDKQLAEVPGAA